MTYIITPTIDLFIYDLISSLDDSSDDIDGNRQYFLSRFHPTIQQQLQFNHQSLETEYKHLLPSVYAPLEPNTSLEEGYYYPVQLGDSYGLLLELTSPEKEPQSPEYFAQLKLKIEQKLGDKIGTLGQTWLISAYVPVGCEIPPEKIAQDCYKSLMPNFNWDEELDAKGHFLGAEIFELSRGKLTQTNADINKQSIPIVNQLHHVVITIYPNQDSFNQLADFYTDWMRLFYYHHKIIWSYGQTRLISKYLKKEFGQIYNQIETVGRKFHDNEELPYLKNVLISTQNKLNFYTANLNNLNFQPGTIEINLSNYQKRVTTLINKTRKQSYQNYPSDVSFFQEFSDITQEKYLLQIQKDINNLQLGLKMLENTISAVRSRVELEKVTQDQRFQGLVTLVGGCWAISNIVSNNVYFGKKDEITGELIDPLQINKLPIIGQPKFLPLAYNVMITGLVLVIIITFRGFVDNIKIKIDNIKG